MDDIKTLLLVGCDNETYTSISHSIHNIGKIVNIIKATDIEQAANFVLKKRDKSSQHIPDVILLDASISGKDGLKLLKRIKTGSEYEKTPVVIMSDGDEEDIVENFWRNKVNSCIKKSFDVEMSNKIFRGFSAFWLKHNIAPAKQ